MWTIKDIFDERLKDAVYTNVAGDIDASGSIWVGQNLVGSGRYCCLI